MNQVIISRARPDADYQAHFHYAPLSGWAVHYNGRFSNIFATQSDALEAVQRCVCSEDEDVQITIDCRG